MHNIMLAVLLAALIQGCAVGVISVNTQPVPPLRPAFLGNVYYDICNPISSDDRSAWSQPIESALLRGYGIRPRIWNPVHDKPFFDFIVTSKTEFKYSFSGILSFLTFSVIPGYSITDHHVDIKFAAMDANGLTSRGKFSYPYSESVFLWLPLIIYPDVVGSVNGGYINKDKGYRVRELIVRKFILDATDRTRSFSTEANKDSLQSDLVCPAPTIIR